MNPTHRILSYLNYHFHKKGKHGIHSPFVFDFVVKVLNDKQMYSDYSKIEQSRKRLLHDHNTIETVDFGSGAGNKDFITFRSTVKNLTQKRAQSIAETRLLYRISRYFKPKTILELGTSTGLSTIALALGYSNAQLYTIEGCASLASVAESQFNKLNISNIHQIIGNFNDTLSDVIEKVVHLDMVFFDGNHRKTPTLDYFNHCLTKAGSNSVFIFDDIHWSEEMEETWSSIQQHPDVRLTLDLYSMGLVFFDKGITKQHFVLSI